MGGFVQGLGQGMQNVQSMQADIENRRQQAELFKLKSKQMQLETDMTERQMKAQADLPNMLFQAPQQRQVPVQGPGAPQEPADKAGLLAGYSPGELERAGGEKGVLKQYATEGPQPTGMADIPGTGGPLAGVSPELQGIFQNILVSTGGDMGKTMSTIQMLAPGLFPQKPQEFDLAPEHTRFRQGPDGKAVPIAQGAPKYRAPHVVQGSLVDDEGNVRYQAPEKPDRPSIKEVDTPQGKQFMSVTPEGVQPIGQPIQTAPAAPKSIDTENAIAMEMFNTDYASLQPNARAEVNRRIKADKLDLYKAQADVMVAAAGERERVKLATPEKPSGVEREKLIGGVNTIDQLNRVAELYDPSLVGPTMGAMSELRASLPENWGGLSPKQAALYGAISTFRNRLMNLISGAAVSPDEARRLISEMPDPSQDPAVFEERWANSYRNAEALAKTQRQVYGETGVDLHGLSPLPTPHPKFANKFAQNVIPQPPPVKAKPKAAPAQQPGEAQAAQPQADQRMQQLGPMGQQMYQMQPDSEKQAWLDRYFKAMEGKQGAPKR